jgi:hypothetical protein
MPEWGGNLAGAVGTATMPTNVARERDRIVAQAGVPQIRVHDLRQSKVSTTGNIYVRADVRLQRAAAEWLAAALRGDARKELRAKKRAKYGENPR